MLGKHMRFFRSNRPEEHEGNNAEYLKDSEAIEKRELSFLASSTVYLLLGSILFAIVFAGYSEIDKIVIARGEVVTTRPTIVVQPLERSILRSIDVRLGQRVRKDELLGSFDPTFPEADLKLLEEQLSSLEDKRLRLEAELEKEAVLPVTLKSGVERSIFLARQEQYNLREEGSRRAISRLEGMLELAVKEQKTLQNRLKVLRKIEKMRSQLLEKRTVSKTMYLASQEARLEVQAEYDQANSRVAELSDRLERQRDSLGEFQRQWHSEILEDLDDVKNTINSVRSRVGKAQRVNDLVDMRSPMNATVLDIIDRSIGSVIQSAEPVFTLIPENTELEIESYIRSRDIGFVEAGDEVVIKLDAFPYQKFGYLSGVVSVIGEASMPNGGQKASAEPQGSFYKARIKIVESNLAAGMDRLRLMPGMTASTEIKVGKRNVLSYFLYPILRTLDESVREP